MMQLGRTLQGKEPIEGVKINKALGDKIIEAVRYKAKEFGDWHTAAYRYAKQDMDTFYHQENLELLLTIITDYLPNL